MTDLGTGRQDGSTLEESYRLARRITKAHARTFYFASHTLPSAKRRQAYAVYSYCRFVDDRVDLAPSVVEARAAVDDLRAATARWVGAENNQSRVTFEASAADASLPWLPAFLDTVADRHIPARYFFDLLRGVELDLGQVRIQTWPELEAYCYHVASVVGLIMVHIFTEPRPELLEPASQLGTGMQLTNILRDIDEDYKRGRIYLPEDELLRFGLAEDDIAHGRVGESFRAMMRFQIARARDYYRRSEAGIEQLPRDGTQLTTWLMRDVYAGILGEIEKSHMNVFTGRVRVSLPKKLALASSRIARYAWTGWTAR